MTNKGVTMSNHSKKVLILGGYGIFGQRIANSLAKRNIPVIICGRNKQPAHHLQQKILSKYPNACVTTAIFDCKQSLPSQLRKLNPTVVINTCGPFQGQSYNVANTCTQHRIHYIDLADAGEFVANISKLDPLAKQAGVAVISGASTVPCLSSAVIEQFKPEFKHIQTLRYGITPGQQSERGVATAASILSYLGKPITTHKRHNKKRYGWQNIYRQHYPDIGKRWMANCEAPDDYLFQQHYGIDNLEFSAGMESGCLHIGMWLTSWLVRLKLFTNLKKHAKSLLTMSTFFDRFGSQDGGMHMILKGTDHQKLLSGI